MDTPGVAGFVEALAADPPGPAAGSAAAITVAMAAALAELAARRSGEAETAARAGAVRAGALPLAEADARAYGEVLHSRGPERREALARASDVLREIAQAAVETQRLAEPLVESAKAALRGEALAAVELAAAAGRVAERLIEVNCASAG